MTNTTNTAAVETMRAAIGQLLNEFGERQWQSGRGVPHKSIKDAFDAIIERAALAAPAQAVGPEPVVSSDAIHPEIQATLATLDVPVVGYLSSHSGALHDNASKVPRFESAIPLVRESDHRSACEKIMAVLTSAAPATAAPAQAGEYPAGTGNPEADRIIGRLASSDPDFDDCADAVALIHKLVAEIKGPDGFDTWKDAAIADRAARGAAKAQGARQPLTDSQISDIYFEALGSQHLREQDRKTVTRFARAIEAATTPQPAAPAQPVAWALQWPDDSRLNLSTVFDTQLEATDYLKSCSDGVVVVPLYAAPQQAAQDAPVDAESWLDLLADARAALWQPANAALCERLDAFIDAARAAQKDTND